MFIGHFGLGFAAKNINQKPSLGTFFLAAQFVDLLWPFFLLMGIEKVKIEPGNTRLTPLNFIYYPFSHSLFSVIIWSVLFGAFYYLMKKDRKSALLLGFLVFSHWILDLLTHRQDLPIGPWSTYKAGLGLWNMPVISMLTEGFIFVLGAWLYIRNTEAKNKTGSVSLWSLLIFLSIIFIMNSFGNPPPSEKALAIVGLSQWLLIGWGYWIDRNRMTVVTEHYAIE